MTHKCPDCHNEFVQPFVCTTCGAQKLYDVTVTHLQEQNEYLRSRVAQCMTDHAITIGERDAKIGEAMFLRARLAEAVLHVPAHAALRIQHLESRLAEAEALLHSTRLTLIEVAEHSDFEEGAEFGVRSCCHVGDYRPHADSCAVMRSISGIDAHLARKP